MHPMRLAVVEYVNTVPLISGLLARAGLELLRLPPAKIAPCVLAGEADAGLVSIADAADSAGALTLLKCGMIGCDGATMTVGLFSRRPLGEIAVLHADDESKTSVALCRLILHRVYGAHPSVVPVSVKRSLGARDDASGVPEAVLLIGDKVITHAPPADEYPYRIDLGEAWKAWTGAPFAYASWAIRSDRADEPWVDALVSVLDRQRRRNAMRLGRIVAEEAVPHGWSHEDAGRYLGGLLRYEVTEPAQAAADLFVREAAELGILTNSTLRWREARPVLV